MRIERATRADLPVVIRLVERLLSELADGGDDEFTGLDRARTLAELEAEGDRFVALLARDGAAEPDGVLTLTESFAIFAGGRYGVIDELWVDPARRSSGLGRRLLQAAVDVGRERGWRRLDVTAPAGDAWRRTVAFYEKNGFVFTGPKLRLRIPSGI